MKFKEHFGKHRGLYAFFILTVTVALVSYAGFVYQRHSSDSYHYFENLEFGTDLEIVVAPHGIYTEKYVTFATMTKLDFETFVSFCEAENATVYCSSTSDGRFWAYLCPYGPTRNIDAYVFEVPYRWF